MNSADSEPSRGVKPCARSNAPYSTLLSPAARPSFEFFAPPESGLVSASVRHSSLCFHSSE